MKVIIHVNHAAHQLEHGEALREGLARHGVSVQFATRDVPTPGDIVVTWSIKQPLVIAAAKASGTPLLVMERGHLPNRMAWTSCGWGGLGGRGTYPAVDDGGDRWRRHWPDLMKPWRAEGCHALLLGQVAGDAALYSMEGTFDGWAQRVCDELRAAGWADVVFRPHPLTRRHGAERCPEGARLSKADALDADLDGAAVAVGFNSTALVETVLAGVPTVTLDPAGAMAAPVAMHGIPKCGSALDRPDRTQWAHRLAWCQWSLDEIRAGTAWEHLRACL